MTDSMTASEDDSEGDEDFDEVHGDCFQPHRDHNGEYVDCDGRPI